MPASCIVELIPQSLRPQVLVTLASLGCCNHVTEGGGFGRSVRLALNGVMQNDAGLRGCNPAIPPGLTLKTLIVLPTQCMCFV